MISVSHAFILGIIQGLGEFLPISSSAHLILVPSFMGWIDPGLSFDVALHLGTLAALVVYFGKDLWKYTQSVLNPGDKSLDNERKMVGYLIVATIPGAIAGLLLEHRAETVFRSPALIAGALILMGLGLGLADWFGSRRKKLADVTFPFALAIGLAQCLALIPGVSRSGITITLAMALGFDREDAARFSFLMSVPIIAGAGILKLKQILHSPDHLALAAGFGGAAVAGLVAIWALLTYVQTRRYTPFVLYRLALGAFVLLNLAHFS